MKNRKVESYFTIALPSFSQICINSRFLCIKSNAFLCFLLLFLASLFLLVILIKRRIGNGFSTLIKLVVYEVAMHIGLQHVAANEVFQSQFSKFFPSDLGIMKNIKIIKISSNHRITKIICNIKYPFIRDIFHPTPFNSLNTYKFVIVIYASLLLLQFFGEIIQEGAPARSRSQSRNEIRKNTRLFSSNK